MKFNILNQSIIMRKLILALITLLFLIPYGLSIPSLDVYSPQNTTYSQFTIPYNISSNETINLTITIIKEGKPPVNYTIENIREYTRNFSVNGGKFQMIFRAENQNGVNEVTVFFIQNLTAMEIPIYGCADLIETTETYVLMTDIVDSSSYLCMHMPVPAVTLDCYGHLIDGQLLTDQTGILSFNSLQHIANCRVTDWWHGIEIRGISGGTSRVYIYWNNITHNKYGIVAYADVGYEITLSEIFDNRIIGNDAGILFWSIDGSFRTNKVYNNLFNNSINIYVEYGYLGYNDWNTTRKVETNIIGGRFKGGNYWGKPDLTGFSDTCIDSDADGFCDSPYTIASSNIDYLPLSRAIKKLIVTRLIYPSPPVYLDDVKRLYTCVKNVGTIPVTVRVGLSVFAGMTSPTSGSYYEYPPMIYDYYCNGNVKKFDDWCYVDRYTYDIDGNKWLDILTIPPGTEACYDVDFKFTSKIFKEGDSISLVGDIWDNETGELYHLVVERDVFTLELPLYACAISLKASHRVARIGETVTYWSTIKNYNLTWNFSVILGIGIWDAMSGIEYREPRPTILPPTYSDINHVIIPKDYTNIVQKSFKLPDYFPLNVSYDVAVEVWREATKDPRTGELVKEKPICFVYFKNVTLVSTEPAPEEVIGETLNKGVDATIGIVSRAIGITPVLTKNLLWVIFSIIVGGLVIFISRSWQIGIISLLCLLVVGALIGWFPGWLVIILLVISAMIVAQFIRGGQYG
jgi:hypothetical protein